MKKTSLPRQIFLTLSLTWALFSLALLLSMAQVWTYPSLSTDRTNSHDLSETTIQCN